MRHIAYGAYLLRHKFRVFLHSVLLAVPLRGLLHDLSKLHPVEWTGFGRQFYPSRLAEKESNRVLFKEAKAHHRKHNQHEIDYWYRDDGSCDPIPVAVLKEAMADWAAFGGHGWTKATIRHHARGCYQKWGRNYRMHATSRAWIETFLELEVKQDGT